MGYAIAGWGIAQSAAVSHFFTRYVQQVGTL